MKSIVCASLVVLATTTAASAVVLDAFDVSATNDVGTVSTLVLNAGQEYILGISGTVTFGNGPSAPRIADAAMRDLLTNPVPLPGLAIRVDGVDVLFGPYDPSNAYEKSIYGTGNTINVSFFDTAYQDNAGAFQVTISDISSVPLPAGGGLLMASLAGLAWARRRKA